MTPEKRSKAIDLSHHLSDVSRARQLSPLKGLQKYFTGNAIPLAGGMPSPAYFPFASVSADALVSDSFPLSAPDADSRTGALAWLWRLFGTSDKGESTTRIAIPKAPAAGDDGLNLATALQYGPATGLAPLQAFINEFSAAVYRPAFSDCATLVHTGNTDGWSRVVGTLCNPGDTVITEEWTYPSAVASVQPYGVGVMPVLMDGEGMRADSLRALLAQWDESKGKRPHVMYTVPVGQNPSGATMGIQRKREIYDVCVEYDVIIVEDDPYYFLQVGPYVPKSERTAEPSLPAGDEVKQFINSLAPSFLKIDYQGRVIRLDTFSKTIAPGVRLGWFTANPMFIERLERHGETTTQSPCGLGQSLVMKLLQTWTYAGYIRWLRGLRMQYKARRDLFVDLLAGAFDLQRAVGTREMGAWAGMTVYTAYAKHQGGMWGAGAGEKTGERDPLFSFVPPSSGMFVWVKVHFGEHTAGAAANKPVGDDTLEMKLWIKLAEAGVLMAPGWYFAADKDEERIPADPNVEGHLRMSFSNAEFADMRKAVDIFSKTLKKFFEEL
ncbi:PLP-dependent transferase [Dentipellis sp. KUC8613]|nr:PLP-dependent transferase [Dentipellis sp. KUC8613]